MTGASQAVTFGSDRLHSILVGQAAAGERRGIDTVLQESPARSHNGIVGRLLESGYHGGSPSLGICT
jgi:hypothetical protein